MDPSSSYNMAASSSSSHLYSAFIGNLRSDIDDQKLKSDLQLLFETVGVTVLADDFQTYKKQLNKPSFALVTLQDKSTFDFVEEKLNGTFNDDIVFPGKQLVVSTAHKQNPERHSSSKPFPKPLRKHSKRKKHNNHPMRYDKLPSIALGTDPFNEHSRNTHSQDSSIVHSSLLPSIESNSKYFYIGEKLGTEDRLTEYKQGGGKYLENKLKADVEKYVCAFLNSEGGNLLIGVKDDCTVCGIEISSSKREDLLRLELDNIMKGFKPEVFPNLYSITFIPVCAAVPQKQTNSQEREVSSNCIYTPQNIATLPLIPEPLLKKQLKIRNSEGLNDENLFVDQPQINLNSAPSCSSDFPSLSVSPIEENTSSTNMSSNIDTCILAPNNPPSLICPKQNNGDPIVFNAKESVLKVLKISVHPPSRQVGGQHTLYQNHKREVYIRRDGSVQGPLQASEIVEWSRCNTMESLNMEHDYLKQQVDRKQEEISMNMKLVDELVKQKDFLQNQYKEQESLLTSEIDRLKNREREMENELEQIRRTKSKICVIQ